MCESAAPSQPSSVSQTTSNIPDWAIPYATRNLGQAEALTDINQNPYQTYQGNRVADFNPLQNQAFSNVAGMQTNTGTGNAMNQTQDAYNRSANAGPYNAQNFGNQYGSGPQFQNMGLGYLSANAQNFGQQSAQDYMSPYQQNVTDFQKQQAINDYGRNLPGMNAQASSAGAFGGTRQALVAAEGQRNLQNQLGGIQAIGSQNAYQNAQQQFNADQARRMQAQLANQGAYAQMQGLGMQQNLSANQQAQQNAQLQAQYGLAGQQAGEASRQFGANYGLQNRQQALAAAGQLGTLGQQQYAQQMGINSAQQQAGAQMQAQEQQGLSNKYQDFLNQQNYPYKQLGFMSDIMRGTPTSGGAQSIYQAPGNTLGQIAGLGLAGYGAFKKEGGIISGYKHGGKVRNFAEGGLASLTDPATEIAAKSKLPPTNSAIALAKFMLPVIQKMHQPVAKQDSTTVAVDMAREILSFNAPQDMQQDMQQQDMQQPPQETPDMSGIASLPVNNFQEENYRGGGIVAFQQGGRSPSYETGEGDATSILPAQFKPIIPVDSSSAGKYGELLKTLEADRLRYAPESDEVIAAANKAARERAGITGLVGDTRMAQLTKDRSGEEERKDQAAKNFFISTGLNMAAEASKRGNPVSGLASILQPLSVGADKALPGYFAEQEKLKSLTETRNKEMGDIENSRRAEAAGIVTLNQATKDKQLARIEKIDERILGVQSRLAESSAAQEAAIAGKMPTDMISYGQSYLKAARAKGDARPEAVIVSEGQLSHTREKAQYPVGVASVGQRGLAAGETADISREELERKDRKDAGDKASKSFEGAGALPLLQAQNLDRQNAAENAKDKGNRPTNNELNKREQRNQEMYDIIIQNRAATGSRAAQAKAAQNRPAGTQAPSAANKVYVTTPKGTYEFDTQAQADAYKRSAGIN